MVPFTRRQPLLLKLWHSWGPTFSFIYVLTCSFALFFISSFYFFASSSIPLSPTYPSMHLSLYWFSHSLMQPLLITYFFSLFIILFFPPCLSPFWFASYPHHFGFAPKMLISTLDWCVWPEGSSGMSLNPELSYLPTEGSLRGGPPRSRRWESWIFTWKLSFFSKLEGTD